MTKYSNLGFVPDKKATKKNKYSDLNFVPDEQSKSVNKFNFSALPGMNQISQLAQQASQTSGNPAFRFAEGAGSEIHNLGADLLGLIPGVNIKQMQAPEGIASKAGSLGADLGSFAGGGEVLEGARAAGEAAPYLGKLLEMLGGGGASGIARRGAGAALYGGITEPGNRASGAESSAITSGALDMLPYVGRIANAVRPTRFAEQMLNDLGSGDSVSESNKKLAQLLKSQFKANKNGYTNRLSNLLGGDSNSLITDRLTNKKFTPQDESGNFNSLISALGGAGSESDIQQAIKSSNRAKDPINLTNYGKLKNKSYLKNDYQLRDYHNDYVKNPTLENHNQLKVLINNRLNGFGNKIDASERDAYNALKDAKKAHQKDLLEYFDRKDPSGLLKQSYLANENYYRRFVAPFDKNRNLRKIIRDDDYTRPSSNTIRSIFGKDPDENLLGIINSSHPEIKNRILYNELGLNTNRKTAEKLSSSIKKLLSEKNYQDYNTSGLEGDADVLDKKIRNRNLMNNLGAGAVAFPIGAAIGHTIGGGFGANELGGLLGAGAAAGTGMRYGAGLMEALRNSIGKETKSAIKKSIKKSAKGSKSLAKSQSPGLGVMLQNIMYNNN